MKKRYVGGKVLKFKQKKVGVKNIKNQTKEKQAIWRLKNDVGKKV